MKLFELLLPFVALACAIFVLVRGEVARRADRRAYLTDLYQRHPEFIGLRGKK